jgi:RNA polymerase sigma-70 factor (ECF subfamily)
VPRNSRSGLEAGAGAAQARSSSARAGSAIGLIGAVSFRRWYSRARPQVPSRGRRPPRWSTARSAEPAAARGCTCGEDPIWWRGRPLEDAALIARAKAGDAASYETLVRRYQEIAFRTAYLIAGNAAEAEDAAQEGFVKAFYALDRFRDGTPLRPWLLTIVANEARNRRKASTRRANLAHALRAAGEASSVGPAAGDAAPSPEAAVLAAELRGALLSALRTLRDEERLALECRYFLDLSEAEMAQVLGCPRGTVKSRLSRGLAHLREWLNRAEAPRV